MPHIQNLPPDLTTLPDWAVLTDQQTVELLGVSRDTLKRLDRVGDGPPRVNLSPRRHGRTVGGLRKWIQRRLSKRPRATDAAPDGCGCEP
jgi:predicted DNA-binding transcriptional regulator AlpA